MKKKKEIKVEKPSLLYTVKYKNGGVYSRHSSFEIAKMQVDSLSEWGTDTVVVDEFGEVKYERNR